MRPAPDKLERRALFPRRYALSAHASPDPRLAESARANTLIACLPRHGCDRESLMRAADAAMYEVKRSGKNTFAIAPGPASKQARLSHGDQGGRTVPTTLCADL